MDAAAAKRGDAGAGFAGGRPSADSGNEAGMYAAVMGCGRRQRTALHDSDRTAGGAGSLSGYAVSHVFAAAMGTGSCRHV